MAQSIPSAVSLGWFRDPIIAVRYFKTKRGPTASARAVSSSFIGPRHLGSLSFGPKWWMRTKAARGATALAVRATWRRHEMTAVFT